MGTARAKSDDDLIALGQEDMEVDFEFVLDGTLRRVMRRRTKGKRGQTIVDFQVQEADGPGGVSAAMACAIQKRRSSRRCV